MSWTDERVETLERLWALGLPGSEIARQLGGVSRNAVLNKAYRLGLESRPSPIRPKTGSRTKVQQRQRKQLLAHERPDPEAVEIIDPYGKETGCQWPLWDDKPTHEYCNAERVPGRAYCEAHYERSVIRTPKKEAA